jgi:hypothetical protein
MEVDVQPDRENAECDDAAVEVAAHLFFASLSRGLLLRERCVSFARLAPRERCAVAAVVKTLFAVAFDPNSSLRSHQTRVRGM